MRRETPQGPEFISCLKVEMAGISDLYALLVTTDEERQTFVSTIFMYPGFPGVNPVSRVHLRDWIVDFTVLVDGTILAVTAGGETVTLRPGETNPGTLEKRHSDPFSSIRANETRTAALAVGWEGGAFLYRDGAWHDLPSPGPGNLSAAGISREGRLYVGSESGALSVFEGNAWTRIALDRNVSIDAIAFGPDKSVLIGGSNGTVLLSQDGLSFQALDAAGGDVKGAAWHRGKFIVAGPGISFLSVEPPKLVPFKTGRSPYKVTTHGDWILAAEDDGILYCKDDGWFRMPL